MHQIRPISWKEKWKEKFSRSGYFFAALLFHIILFLLVATVIVFQAPTPPVETEFQAIHIAVPPPPPVPPPSGDAARTAAEIQPVVVPPSAPTHLISNAQNTSFQVDASRVVANALSHMNVPSPQSSGMTEGGGSLNPGLGSGASAGFFGIKTEGKRIAFLLDYSGTMEGAFRLTMERQLQKSLASLPEGTQVILICWAGPAWLHSQTAPQIAKNWKKGHGFDDFSKVPGYVQEPPTWISLNPTAVEDIMKGIKAQVSAPGGTDWRHPFRYAMKADPPPDTIFFLTDGQIRPTAIDRVRQSISTSMSKVDTVPIVNCLWIENTRSNRDELEKLSRTYKGEFRRVSAHGDGP